ncbi:FHA domain-containing protein [Pirellulales bacterium]|nr:FHA domain-containing protein [Pirellulales bacterium]
MSTRLLVRSNTDNWEFPLRKASLTLGSAPQLELRVPHPEVASKAATIDNRGPSALIINHNSFPIFVGAEQIEPGGCAPWTPGDVVQLTRNISLGLDGVSGDRRPGDASAGQSGRRYQSGGSKHGQIPKFAVIGVCLFLSVFMLIRGEVSQTSGPQISFAELLEQTMHLRTLNPNNAEPLEQILTTLQDAQVAELRFRHTDPKQVVKAYRRLLATEVVRRPNDVQKDLAVKLKQYGSERIQAMWIALDRH